MKLAPPDQSRSSPTDLRESFGGGIRRPRDLSPGERLPPSSPPPRASVVPSLREVQTGIGRYHPGDDLPSLMSAAIEEIEVSPPNANMSTLNIEDGAKTDIIVTYTETTSSGSSQLSADAIQPSSNLPDGPLRSPTIAPAEDQSRWSPSSEERHQGEHNVPLERTNANTEHPRPVRQLRTSTRPDRGQQDASDGGEHPSQSSNNSQPYPGKSQNYCDGC